MSLQLSSLISNITIVFFFRTNACGIFLIDKIFIEQDENDFALKYLLSWCMHVCENPFVII